VHENRRAPWNPNALGSEDILDESVLKTVASWRKIPSF